MVWNCVRGRPQSDNSAFQRTQASARKRAHSVLRLAMQSHSVKRGRTPTSLLSRTFVQLVHTTIPCLVEATNAKLEFDFWSKLRDRRDQIDTLMHTILLRLFKALSDERKIQKSLNLLYRLKVTES